MKLSKTQAQVLFEMKEHDAVIHCIGGIDSHLFLSGSMNTVRFSTLHFLENNGLVFKDRTGKGHVIYRMTDKGREQLKIFGQAHRAQ